MVKGMLSTVMDPSPLTSASMWITPWMRRGRPSKLGLLAGGGENRSVPDTVNDAPVADRPSAATGACVVRVAGGSMGGSSLRVLEPSRR